MIFSTLLESIAQILHFFLNAYLYVVIIATFVSFIQPNPNHPIIILLHRLTTPVYQKMRKFFPTTFNQVDFAPAILIALLLFADSFFVKLLSSFAKSLGSTQ